MQEKLQDKSGFCRETQADLYDLYNSGAEIPDLIYKIVPEGTSRTELYTMSVTQFDYKTPRRKYPFDFYFYADYLYNVGVHFNDEIFLFSYEHCPVEDNPYHFQFFTKDSNGEKLPRKAQKKSEQNKNKMLADVIYENILSEAVCFDTDKLVSCV